MNYYCKQVIILTKKLLTVDFGWDCNEGMYRCVFIFCIEMNIPAVSRGSGASMWVCSKGTNMS